MLRASCVAHRVERLAVDLDGSRAYVVKAREAVEESRLSRTGRAHHGHHLAGPDVEVELSERLGGLVAGAVGLADATGRQDQPVGVATARNVRGRGRSHGPEARGETSVR